MRPTSRNPVNKARSAADFRNTTRKTKGANVTAPMRGGIRL